MDSFLTYEEQVVKRFIEEFGKDKEIQTNYRYLYNNKVYRFDMVELDHQDNILKIYEIKTHSAAKFIPNSIKKLLQTYKEIAKEDVCLVYLEEQLHVISLSDFNKDKKEYIHPTYTTESFSDFYCILKQYCKNNNDLIFFRGHSDYDYELYPSIYRDGYIKDEDMMYREAIRKIPSEFTEDLSTFDKLVKMRHFGLPTRLLDITSNPLVALYFACQEKKDNNNQEKDGEVLLFDIPVNQAEFFDSTAVCILSNLAKQPNDFSFSRNKEMFAKSIKQDKTDFSADNLKSDAVNQTICVRPKLNNDRILRQDGAFFIFGIDGDNKKDAKKLEDDPITFRIKAERKDTILEELRLLGINKASLFPEIENIMQDIMSSYGK